MTRELRCVCLLLQYLSSYRHGSTVTKRLSRFKVRLSVTVCEFITAVCVFMCVYHHDYLLQIVLPVPVTVTASELSQATGKSATHHRIELFELTNQLPQQQLP